MWPQSEVALVDMTWLFSTTHSKAIKDIMYKIVFQKGSVPFQLGQTKRESVPLWSTALINMPNSNGSVFRVGRSICILNTHHLFRFKSTRYMFRLGKLSILLVADVPSLLFYRFSKLKEDITNIYISYGIVCAINTC